MIYIPNMEIFYSDIKCRSFETSKNAEIFHIEYWMENFISFNVLTRHLQASFKVPSKSKVNFIIRKTRSLSFIFLNLPKSAAVFSVVKFEILMVERRIWNGNCKITETNLNFVLQSDWTFRSRESKHWNPLG